MILPSNRFIYLKNRAKKKKKKGLSWKKEWLPTPVFLLGKSHGHRSLGGSIGLQKVSHDLATNTNTLTLCVDFSSSKSPFGELPHFALLCVKIKTSI